MTRFFHVFIVLILLAFSGSASASPEQFDRPALLKAFSAVSKDFVVRRGAFADKNFAGMKLTFRENEVFVNAGEWMWISGGEMALWRYSCYLSAEEGPQCFPTGGVDKVFRDKSFRTLDRPRFFLREALDAVATTLSAHAWNGPMQAVEVYAAADGMYVRMIGLTLKANWWCSFSGNCSSVRRLNPMPDFESER